MLEILEILKILQDFINQGNYDLINTYKLYLKIDDIIKTNTHNHERIANIFIEIVIQSKFNKYDIIENILKKFADANFNIDIVKILNFDDKLYNNQEIIHIHINRGLLVDIICKYYNILEQCKNFYRFNKNIIHILSRYSNYLYYIFPNVYAKLEVETTFKGTKSSLNNEISLNNAFEFLIKSIINNKYDKSSMINKILLFKKTQNGNEPKSLIIIDDKIFDVLINDNLINHDIKNISLLIGTLIDIFDEHFIIDISLKYDWKNIIARKSNNFQNQKSFFEYIKYYSKYLRKKYHNINDEPYQIKNYPMRYSDGINDYMDNRYDNIANTLLINDYPNIGWDTIFNILSHFDADRKLNDFNDKFELLYESFNNDYNTLYDIIYEMLERDFDAQEGFKCFIIFFCSKFSIENDIDLFNNIVNLFIRYGAYIHNIDSMVNDITINFTSNYDTDRLEYLFIFYYRYNNMFYGEYFSNSPNTFFNYDLRFFDNLGKIIDLILPLQNLLENSIIENLKTLMNSNLLGLLDVIMDYVDIFKINWANIPSFENFCDEINLNPYDEFDDRLNINLYQDFYLNINWLNKVVNI